MTYSHLNLLLQMLFLCNIPQFGGNFILEINSEEPLILVGVKDNVSMMSAYREHFILILVNQECGILGSCTI